VCRRAVLSALLVSALLLTSVAWLRGAEYDEQYTLFLTGREARPTWPAGVITAGTVREAQAAHAGFTAIARDLRTTDVHPPLYFWAVAAWRRLAGNSLFAARLASVLFSVVTLGLVAAIARSAGIPAVPAVLLTVGCYGFAYTGTIARGFALAQMLSVAGVALLRAPRRRPYAAGALLGAATFANYLAVFVAFAGLVSIARRLRLGPVLVGFAIWLPADLWFFLAQRESRAGQFVRFEPVAALTRLAQYCAANLFGGLPLYVDGVARTAVAVAVVVLLAGLAAFIVRRWRHIATPDTRLLLAMAAAAPPAGLLLLGVAFDNTPIELRYLAFATPFIGLLLAAALPRWMRHAVLAVQAMALVGLATRPETMQPARATAIAAASLAGDGVVLLPYGNDGVGIVGAFAAEAPPALRLLVIGSAISADQIRARATPYPRVVLALLGQDAASRATLPAMRLAFTDPCWRASGEGFNVLAFNRICGE
jgi:hypothetical protein